MQDENTRLSTSVTELQTEISELKKVTALDMSEFPESMTEKKTFSEAIILEQNKFVDVWKCSF